jgi:hypothetical protein
MHPYLLLTLWTSASVIHVVLCIPAYRRHHRASLVVSGLAAVAPVAFLFAVIRVFVIGGASNVAQIASGGGSSGLDLWSLWFHLYPWLFFSCMASVLASAVAVALPPYPPKLWNAFVCRLVGLTAALCAFYLNPA